MIFSGKRHLALSKFLGIATTEIEKISLDRFRWLKIVYEIKKQTDVDPRVYNHYIKYTYNGTKYLIRELTDKYLKKENKSEL